MTPITFAHRGGATRASENTIEVFRAAVAHGAAGVESDVHLSSDGIPVLVHAPVIRRGLRRLRVGTQSASDLAHHGVPRLVDLYDAIGESTLVSLDLKVPGAGAAVIDAVGSRGRRERLWLCSPDLAVLSELRAADEAVRLVHSTTRRAVFDQIERHAATLAAERIDAFNMHRSEWSRGLVTLFHRFDVLAFAWDAQEVRHLRDVLVYGVDAVYSDHVDRMVAVVGEWAAEGAAESAADAGALEGAESGEGPDEDEGLPDDARSWDRLEDG